MSAQLLHVTGVSDGDEQRRPKTDDFTRNDEYWLERVANLWAKDLGLSKSGVTYCLDRLPDGYGGYEKARGAAGGDSNHIDRYIYGHAKGAFRSLPEFYPHFKWLVEHDSAVGCKCRLCSGNTRAKGGRVSDGGSGTRKKSVDRSQYRATPPRAAPSPASQVKPTVNSRPRVGPDGLVQGRPPPDPSIPPRGKQVDDEGTPDVLRLLIDRLKAAGSEGMEQSIVENLSPDWRAGHNLLFSTLQEWKALPSYVPRQGELVMFIRQLGPKEALGWDSTTQTWFKQDTSTTPPAWTRLKWEAGVVTQMPTEGITDDDLGGVPEGKHHSVINAGFRIEPLSQPNNMSKSYTRQHKYVYLHAIRPLCMWKECVRGLNEADWHPTIRHALTVASSVCLVGRYHFKGTWPEATVFCSGIFIGAELVMLGDAVRLHPRSGEQATDIVTDVIVITAIKMRIVNLNEAGDDDQDDGHPYGVCMHISGKAYTQDPGRSFDGIGRIPISEDSDILPSSLQRQGMWYHICDPTNAKARIEVPYHRVIGRCYPFGALHAWFTSPPDMSPPPTSFQAVKRTASNIASGDGGLSRGLLGIMESRVFSQTHDTRIDTKSGRTWFWADSRLQQLDLHEVNGIPVGVKDGSRNRTKMANLRRAMALLDGRKVGSAEYHALRQEREQVQAARNESVLPASPSELVDGAAQATVGIAGNEGEEEEEEQDAMEVDQPLPHTATMARPRTSEGESGSDVENALAAFKAGLVAKDVEVIVVDDDGENDNDES